MNDGLYNQELLNSMPAVEETKYLRWVHFDKPLAVKMNGKKKIGVVSLILLCEEIKYLFGLNLLTYYYLRS